LLNDPVGARQINRRFIAPGNARTQIFEIGFAGQGVDQRGAVDPSTNGVRTANTDPNDIA
jgi:hypothetical protein